MNRALSQVYRKSLLTFLTITVVATLTSKGYSQLAAVSPAEFEHVEMPDTASLENFPSYRLHQVYSAADFAHLGPGPYTITRVDWRPDGSITEPLTYSSPSWVMNFSTTTKAVGDLSSTFSENIGPDETTVINGPVTLTTENLGPVGGPKAFDYGVDFDQLFTYDPSSGNLLMDLTVVDAVGLLWLDFSFAPTASTSFYWTGTLGPESPIAATTNEQVGGQFGGHAIQFTVVPEPQTAFLLTVGTIIVLMLACRRIPVGFESPGVGKSS